MSPLRRPGRVLPEALERAARRRQQYVRTEIVRPSAPRASSGRSEKSPEDATDGIPER